MYNENLPHLILADGTILGDSRCGYAERDLYCWVKNLGLAEVFAIFTDPEKTKVIRFRYMGVEAEYDDFTDFIQIRKMEDHIEVRLQGGTKKDPEPIKNL